jgi:hypothetical protein
MLFIADNKQTGGRQFINASQSISCSIHLIDERRHLLAAAFFCCSSAFLPLLNVQQSHPTPTRPDGPVRSFFLNELFGAIDENRNSANFFPSDPIKAEAVKSHVNFL